MAMEEELPAGRIDDEAVPGSPSKIKSPAGTEAGECEPMAPHRKKRRAVTCFNYFKEFTENTSLHGMKYLGESRRSVAEKIWWGVMLILSVAVCGYLIMKTWNKWQLSPVIVSFAEKSTPIWQVPFPAITVCSETIARQSVYNFTEMYHREKENFTEEERKDFEAVSLLCDYYADLLSYGSNTTDANRTLNLLTKVAPKFRETMFQCRWKNTFIQCSALFSPIFTEEGLCFTFNMLNAEELFRKEEMHTENNYLGQNERSRGWTLDGGYPADAPFETYPHRGTGSGTKAGLTIILMAHNNDMDYICRGPVQGFKILLHTPSEIPRVSQQYFRVPLAQEVIAAIKPNMMTTSEGLRSYDPRRQCYFPSERRLRFYKIYTQHNCDLECLTNYTLASCGCVSISMPRNNDTDICSVGKVSCMTSAREILLMREIREGLARGDSAARAARAARGLDSVAPRCDCLPACTSIAYDVETSQADFNWQKLFDALKFNEEVDEQPDINFATAVLFFKEAQFITTRRSELYGQTDFLANCGGLLALFLGFSFLSLAEIIYFLTLRALCNLRRKIAGRSIANTNQASSVAAAAAVVSARNNLLRDMGKGIKDAN